MARPTFVNLAFRPVLGFITGSKGTVFPRASRHFVTTATAPSQKRETLEYARIKETRFEVLVRHYSENDLAQVKALHASSGVKYDLPDLAGQELFSKRVVLDESGIVMAGFLKLTAEAYLICRADWRNPSWRDLALRTLHETCRKDAADQGVTEVNAFLMPEIEKKFANRLLRMGWKRYVGPEWRCYSFNVGGS